MNADLALVGYCGMFCRLCAMRCRVPGQARALRSTLLGEAIEHWGPALPGFKEFWAFLGQLTEEDGCCPGCRKGGGYPDCPVRRCARDRGRDGDDDRCVDCPDYPCPAFKFLFDSYPQLASDNRRLKDIGAASWVKEQEGRLRAGFCYADVRRDGQS